MGRKVLAIETDRDDLDLFDLKAMIEESLEGYLDDVKVEDITDQEGTEEELEELNKIVIGALAGFADYFIDVTGHRKGHMYKMVNDFISYCGIKHTGGHSEWRQQCVSEVPK